MHSISLKHHIISKAGIKNKHLTTPGLTQKSKNRAEKLFKHGEIDESLGRGYNLGNIKGEFRHPSHTPWTKGLESTSYRIYSSMGESRVGPISQAIEQRPGISMSSESLMKREDRDTFHTSAMLPGSGTMRDTQRKGLVKQWWETMYKYFPAQTINAVQEQFTSQGVATPENLGIDRQGSMRDVIGQVGLGSQIGQTIANSENPSTKLVASSSAEPIEEKTFTFRNEIGEYTSDEAIEKYKEEGKKLKREKVEYQKEIRDRGKNSKKLSRSDKAENTREITKLGNHIKEIESRERDDAEEMKRIKRHLKKTHVAVDEPTNISPPPPSNPQIEQITQAIDTIDLDEMNRSLPYYKGLLEEMTRKYDLTKIKNMRSNRSAGTTVSQVDYAQQMRKLETIIGDIETEIVNKRNMNTSDSMLPTNHLGIMNQAKLMNERKIPHWTRHYVEEKLGEGLGCDRGQAVPLPTNVMQKSAYRAYWQMARSPLYKIMAKHQML
jgi:hypothetical protein